MPFLSSCYYPFLSCSMTSKFCSHCTPWKAFEWSPLWCCMWHTEHFLLQSLSPALTSFYLCQSKGKDYLGWKWEMSSSKIIGKRWEVCKIFKESREQLLQGMAKVGKQNFAGKFTHASHLALPQVHPLPISVLLCSFTLPHLQSPAPAQHQQRSCCLFKPWMFFL